MKKLVSLLLILALLVANGLIPAFAENDRHVSELRIGTTAAIDGFSLMTESGIFGKLNYYRE